MKKFIKYIYIALAIPFVFTSCLKDKEIIGPNAPGAIKNIIEFKNPGYIQSSTSSEIPLYVTSFDISPSDQLVLEVNYGGAETAPHDINVKVKLDNSLIEKYADDFNELNPDDPMEAFASLPTDRYSISTFDVTIKKGERVGKFAIDLSPDKFTFDDDYALGFSIESSSLGNISGNFGKMVVMISAKNFFDGAYNYKTSAATSLVPNANKSVTLVTVGANRCQLKPGLLGTYSNEVYYTIDPVTNKVTVECPSLGVQEPQDARSVYDPETKTLKVFWKQGNGGRTFEETFTFTGSRG